MSVIIKTVALCLYDNDEIGGEDCCFKKYTLNPVPKNLRGWKVTRCNGDCGRDNCLCVILPPEKIIPRPPHTLMDVVMNAPSPQPPTPSARRPFTMKKAAKKKVVH